MSLDADRRELTLLLRESKSALGKFSLISARTACWLPVGAAIAYPWALVAFHKAATAPEFGGIDVLLAIFWLLAAFGLPVACLMLASRSVLPPPARRLAYAAVAAPPLYVLLGVIASLTHSAVPDIWLWPVGWMVVGAGASLIPTAAPKAVPASTPFLRAIHGVMALLILLFVAFHLLNHLMGLGGADLHARVMKIGRNIYRNPLIEPIFIAMLLFQVVIGVRLVWPASAERPSLPRLIQVGSGIYLAAFIAAHLTSALISARAVHHIDTNWSWAAGLPNGLLLDAWNIRLLPHYAYGAFFVVSHLFCGLHQVLLAHGVSKPATRSVLLGGLAIGFALSVAIVGALVGLRL